MFSIPHLIVIFVVALIIFGPEKLPELARNLGKVMGEFRRATGDLQSTFEGHLRDLERDAEARKIAGKPAGTETLLPPSPFEEPALIAPEGTKPSNAPNAAAIAAGNAEVDAALEAAKSQPANPETSSAASGPSKAHSDASSTAGSSEPEHTPEPTFDSVSDAGFHQS